MIHNERLIVVLDKSHVIQSATVFPIEWHSETEARNLNPLDLNETELAELKSQFISATVAERDALRNELAAMTAERDALLSHLTTVANERDALQIQLQQGSGQ